MPLSITGKQLITLLQEDGWTLSRRSRHGAFLFKRFPGESSPRFTTVPDKSDLLPDGTLGAILGIRQTRLGKDGLQKLIELHGL